MILEIFEMVNGYFWLRYILIISFSSSQSIFVFSSLSSSWSFFSVSFLGKFLSSVDLFCHGSDHFFLTFLLIWQTLCPLVLIQLQLKNLSIDSILIYIFLGYIKNEVQMRNGNGYKFLLPFVVFRLHFL